MGYAMGTNFMSSSKHVFQESVILLAPVDFVPIRLLVSGVSVGNQEECSAEAVLVEDGHCLFKLASQPVVKSDRNECRVRHFDSRNEGRLEAHARRALGHYRGNA